MKEKGLSGCWTAVDMVCLLLFAGILRVGERWWTGLLAPSKFEVSADMVFGIGADGVD